MTALVKQEFSNNSAPKMDAFSGEGASLFSSGSIVENATSEFGGGRTELFSSGSAPTCSAQTHSGEAVMLFSSGS
ncbi:hypothetical protein KMP13_15585 [Epibacterium ulvae]|uniref:DUF6749 family protein n=1 Tax=Epibacterium ulvae TaxID=1156985 RepID=UPI001BFC42AA|nr:DUF6749 family protein [Epibacterium ulvae]MBT8155262.1 hypothetical protein [Epibacterium ulvae]